MGRLSHIVIDIIMIAVIIGMFVLCLSIYSKIQLSLAIGSIIATILGFLLLVFSMLSFQRYPSQAVITAAIAKYEED
jgi:putative effector of murein hydrolase